MADYGLFNNIFIEFTFERTEERRPHLHNNKIGKNIKYSDFFFL